MAARFSGIRGQELLVQELANSRIVANDIALAGALAAVGEVIPVDVGDVIIRQDEIGDGVFFILDGTFSVSVNGREINTRVARDSVGEMATVSMSQRRSATVHATKYSVVLKVDEPNFVRIGDAFPVLWRRMAQDLARRLEERNRLIRVPNAVVRVFVISSSEAMPVAEAIKAELAAEPFEVKLWSDGVFGLSDYAMESLENELLQSDFAVAVAHPDDLAKVRRKKWKAPRDNVVFELGLFMGRLGRRRSILMEPKKPRVKLPSDVSGITTLHYEIDKSKSTPLVGPACAKLKAHIIDIGRFIS